MHRTDFLKDCLIFLGTGKKKIFILYYIILCYLFILYCFIYLYLLFEHSVYLSTSLFCMYFSQSWRYFDQNLVLKNVQSSTFFIS